MDADQVALLNHLLIQVQSSSSDIEHRWQKFSKKLFEVNASFEEHLMYFSQLFPDWQKQPWLAPVCPSAPCALATLIKELSFDSLQQFHAWSWQNPELFWNTLIQKCHIQFKIPPTAILQKPVDVKHPHWLPGATFNIVDSCFLAPMDKTAVIDVDPLNHLRVTTYQQLLILTNCIANTITQLGYGYGDGIAMCMPMHMEAVAIYLAIIKCGAYVIAIADSFSKEEIAQRIAITKAKLIFTQDVTLWGEKKLPLYEKFKVIEPIIVLASQRNATLKLKENDFWFEDILSQNSLFISYPAEARTICNVLFSSGTTATPKAIPWYHSTPIKIASDALLHLNVMASDVLCWPSNIGWMMGPWSLFASLIHQSTLALFPKGAKNRDFGVFVAQAKVTVLGVVPSLVSQWQNSKCMEKVNWGRIRLFTSTGECSTPKDMFYLSYLAHYKPIIEYCGGTEIGGAYISATCMQPNYLSTFTTPAMGLNFIIFNHDEITSSGEVAIIPPSIGLSDTLVNANHDAHYYQDMPAFVGYPLVRRHGDAIQKTENGYFMLQGRVDDSMKLGGIKISAVEIERVLKSFSSVKELAAVSVPLEGKRTEQLVIFIAEEQSHTTSELKKTFQTILNRYLNPLFKIHEVVIVKMLPKTASNKTMRRQLRMEYNAAKRNIF